MQMDFKSDLAMKSLKYVESFFNDSDIKGSFYLPKSLKAKGRWIANYTGSVLGIYYLNNKELKRAVKYQNRGFPPFPGFVIDDNLKPPTEASAILVGGKCNYFAANRTVNLWAFTVKPGASFTVIDHFHEIKDSSTGENFAFRVDLAFILGIQQNYEWSDLELKLSELLLNTIEVWKKS